MPKRILYYPTIDIPNGQWIKNTLLYWDQISSIVPYADFRLSPELALLQSSNCYSPVYPEDIFSKNMDGFMDALERRLYCDLPSHDDQMITIYENKLFFNHHIPIMEHYPEIQRLFENMPQAHYGQYTIGKTAAAIYMRTLADFTVRDNADMVVGTDKTTHAHTYSHSIKDEPIQTGLLLDFVCNRCLPMPHKDVSIEQIIAFKEKHKQQLIDFQTELFNLQTQIENCQTIEEAHDIINDFNKRLQKAIELSEEMFKDNFTAFTLGSLKTAVNCVLPLDGIISLLFNLEDLNEFIPASLENLPFSIAVGLTGFTAQQLFHTTQRRWRKRKLGNFAYIINTQDLTRTPRQRHR